MNISLYSHILGRKSSETEIRKHREFAPDGFQEKIWVLFEGTQAGKEMFDEICEQIFSHVFEEEDEGVASVERFENAMRELNSKIDQKSVLPEDFLRKNSFVILLSVENQIHFTTLGTAEVYFIRENKVMHVSEGITAQNVSDELFVNVASGELQNGDVLIFSTLRLLRYMTHAQMNDIAKNSAKEIVLTIEEFVDSSVGGEIGAITTEGAPALPFDRATPYPSERSERISTSQRTSLSPTSSPSSSVSSLPSWLSAVPFKKYATGIQQKIQGRIPQEVLFLIVGLLGLFLLWSAISMVSSGLNNDTEKYKIMLEEVSVDIGIAHSMSIDGRKDEALKTLEQAEIKAKDAFHNSSFQADASRYLKDITDMKDSLSDTTRISGKSLLDISGEYPNEDLKGVFFFDEEMYIFGEKKLFRTVGNEIETVIDFPEEESIVEGLPLEKKQQMVFLTDRGTIVDATKTKSEYSKTDDPASWKKGNSIGFFDRNIYVLVPDQDEIYKYSRGSDTFSVPSAYNKGADLSGGLSLTIDGNIYVLKEGGEVIKMLRGVPQNFEVEGAPEEFASVDSIYTLPDLDLLLFLDTEGKRVFVFQKNETSAVFQRQIFIDKEDEVLSGIWFDLSANRILVTGKKSVYEIPLTK